MERYLKDEPKTRGGGLLSPPHEGGGDLSWLYLSDPPRCVLVFVLANNYEFIFIALGKNYKFIFIFKIFIMA